MRGTNGNRSRLAGKLLTLFCLAAFGGRLVADPPAPPPEAPPPAVDEKPPEEVVAPAPPADVDAKRNPSPEPLEGDRAAPADPPSSPQTPAKELEAASGQNPASRPGRQSEVPRSDQCRALKQAGRKLVEHLKKEPRGVEAFLADPPAWISSENALQLGAIQDQLTKCAGRLAPEVANLALDVVREARARFEEDERRIQLASELEVLLGDVLRARRKELEWPSATICQGCWTIFGEVHHFQEAIGGLSIFPPLNTKRSLGDVLASRDRAEEAIARVCAASRRIAEIDFPAAFAEARYFFWTESVQTASSFPQLIRDREVLVKCSGN